MTSESREKGRELARALAQTLVDPVQREALTKIVTSDKFIDMVRWLSVTTVEEQEMRRRMLN